MEGGDQILIRFLSFSELVMHIVTVDLSSTGVLGGKGANALVYHACGGGIAPTPPDYHHLSPSVALLRAGEALHSFL